MPSEPQQTFGEWVGQVRNKIQSTRGPMCIHEICQRADKDPTDFGQVLVILAFVDLMRRARWRSPATIGGAGVCVKVSGLFAKSPCDYFYWSLADGALPTPVGLAGFGPGWRGEMLAEKVRLHAETYRPLYGTHGRGPPVPDITLETLGAPKIRSGRSEGEAFPQREERGCLPRQRVFRLKPCPPRMRAILAYSVALVLLAVAVFVWLVYPYAPSSCNAGPGFHGHGNNTGCESSPTQNPEVPILFAIAGLAALATFLARLWIPDLADS
jgi:hypothetical protein